MAEQSFLNKLGMRLGILGSSAALAVAAPIAAGDYSTTAHTAANRTGLYFGQTASNEKIGIVAGGVTGPQFQVVGGGVQLTLSAGFAYARSTFSNAPAVLTAANSYVGQVGVMSAARTATLPAAATAGAGALFIIADESGTVTAGNKITVTAAGGDTINGAATLDVSTAYGSTVLVSNGTSKWTTVGGGGGGGGSALTATFVGYGDGGSLLTGTSDFTRTGTGAVNVGANVSTAPELSVNGAAGNFRRASLKTAGVLRWSVLASDDAESGANAGSEFRLGAYTDGGSLLDYPIIITRASAGTISLGGSTARTVACAGSFSAVAGTFTGLLTCNTVAANIVVTQGAAASGSPTSVTVTGAAHTTLTSTVEASDISFNLARIVQFSTGAITTQRAVVITAPTYAFVAASVITNAATLAITAAPVTGTNATLTNAYALWVQAGKTQLDGILSLGSGLKWTTTTFSNAATVITSSRIISAQIGTMSASRTATLPAANSVPAGTLFAVSDFSGTVTGTNTIVITPAGADTINGGASYTISQAYGRAMLVSDGTSKWTLLISAELPTLVASTWLKSDGTSASWQVITTSDVSGLGGMATQAASAVAITGGTINGTTIGASTPSSGVFTTITAQPAVGSVALTLTGNTQTTSQPVITATQTWNAGGVTFVGNLFNVTNSASAAGSKLFDYQIGSVSMLKLTTTQLVLLGPTVTTSQPVLDVTQDANASGVAFTILKVNLTGTAAAGSLLMDLQTAGASECNVTRTGSMTLAGNLTCSAGTVTCGGLIQANTNTATSGTITSVGKFTQSTNPASSSTAVNAAVWGTIKTLAANAQNNTSAAPGGMIGVQGDAVHAGTGVITAMSALSTSCSTTNSSGTVTTAYNIYIQTGSKSGGTTITTCYGLFIAAQTIGTSNFAISTSTGAVVFGDRLYYNTPNSAPTDGNIPTSAVSWYLNEAGNLLSVRVRYSDGTTLKTGTVALV